MKKFSKTVVVILVLLILLTAYWAWEGRLPDLASLRKAQQETQIAGQDGETLSLQESRPDGASGGQNAGTMQETAEPEPQGTQENGTDRTAEGVRPAQPAETGYAYSLLDEEEKSLYLQMLQSITGFSQETELTTLKPELLEPVFNSVLADHPEIFYVDGYTYTKHTLGEEIHKITFTARYTLTQAEAEQRKKGIEAYIETALSGIHSGMDGKPDRLLRFPLWRIRLPGLCKGIPAPLQPRGYSGSAGYRRSEERGSPCLGSGPIRR